MSVLSDTGQAQVENTLISDGAVTADKLAQLKAEAKDKKQPFLAYLVSSGAVDNEQLTKATAAATGVPYINLKGARINDQILSLIPQDVAERYLVVPLGEDGSRLVVAMLDASNVQVVDFLSNKVGRPLKVYSASEESIRTVLNQYNTKLNAEAVNESLGIDGNKPVETAVETAPSGNTIQELVQDSPISKALSTILEFAARNGASDIHVEPLEKELKIRCRIDGVLREIMRLPKSTEAPLVSRIKILANLKIDEHRIPQDGEFSIRVADKAVDLRIAISPVVWGEQVVIRLLDKSGTSLKLEDMGYRGRSLRMIRSGLKQSHGMILTSGPTGSGKSTSMYALLQELRNDAVNIVTLEDPVEYKMDGINQIQVNPDVGLTFATGLRSVLRQDPDVIMVGEIRDTETAQLAVQAALTGHLVFATLHTNSAAGILPRLLDMEIEPFLIASTVHTVIGQRLLRRNVSTKESYQASPAEVAAIQATLGNLLPDSDANRHAVAADLGYESLPLRTDTAYTLTKGKPNPDSPDGFSGRMGIYEVFEITPTIQQLILQRATAAEIQDAAVKEQGMVTMRQDGYLKALDGITSLSEVDRVAASDNA